MKKLMTMLALCSALTLWAKNEKYVEAMKKNIEVVYKAATLEELQSAVHALARIGEAEKSRWEPFYFASFGNIMMATREPDGAKKDAFLDQAKSMLEKAVAIQPNESELAALEGFIYMIRVTVDPAARGPQYSMLSMQAFGKALTINPNNPRAMALMAQMQFGTAQFFKQEPTEACETARKASTLFANQVITNPLAPVWGKSMADGLTKSCQ
jgi:tetratricopeptide (TPR) repeat protein